MSDAKRYWIPGPLTNYGTTANGFAGEVLVVAAVDYGELERDLRDATIEADRVHKEHAEMIDSYEAKLEEYERRIDELQDEVDSSNQLIDKSARLGTDVCDYDYPPGTAPCMCQFRLVDSSGEPVAECDYHSKIRARLAEALFLLNRWHEAYHADGGMEMLDDDTTTCLAGITVSAPAAQEGAP